jgi:nitrite reductase/ring-hydroxylating ferredoxin subunit
MQSFDTNSDDEPEPAAEKQTYTVCAVGDLPRGHCRRFSLPNGNELAIYNVNGDYHATENFCPHRGAALSDGAMFGHIVECGWHGWQFDVRTGECLTVSEKIKVYRVSVEDDCVLVEVE